MIPTEGQMTIDGRALNADDLAAMRQRTYPHAVHEYLGGLFAHLLGGGDQPTQAQRRKARELAAEALEKVGRAAVGL